MEIFPTQLRSTGTGFASTLSSFVGITGPHIVFTVSNAVVKLNKPDILMIPKGIHSEYHN